MLTRTSHTARRRPAIRRDRDTPFIVDPLYDDPDARAALNRIEAATRPEKIAAITVLGPCEAVPEDRRRQVLGALDTRHTVAVDETVVTRTQRRFDRTDGLDVETH